MPASDPSSAGSSSESVTAAPGTQVQSSESTPKEFVEHLGKRSIVVVLHQPKGVVDALLLAEAKAAAASSKDTILLTYEVADYEEYGDLAEKLGLFRAPSIAVVNRAGAIENFWTSFVDRGLLFHVISKANSVKPAKVTPSEHAPPAPNAINEAATAAASA